MPGRMELGINLTRADRSVSEGLIYNGVVGLEEREYSRAFSSFKRVVE
jgi:hypothetical protein